MKDVVLKLAPSAIVIAAAGFCAWPYFTPGEAPAESKPAATAELRASVLRPDLGRPPVRDPFLDAEALKAEARARVAGALKSLASLSASLRTRKHTSKTKTASVEARAAAAKSAAVKAADAAHPPEVVNPLAGLVLNATYIYDKGGAAVINGKVYLPGDEVKSHAGGKPVRLSEVHFHRVVLKADGAPLELAYDAAPTAAERGARKTANVDTPARAVPKPAAPVARPARRRAR